MTLRESLGLVKKAWKRQEGEKSCFPRFLRVCDASQEAIERGKWVPKKDNPKMKLLPGGTAFMDKFGPTFVGVRGNAWWFGQWRLLRNLAMAIIVFALVDEQINASLVLVFKTMDTLCLLIFRPNADYSNYISDTYKAFVNLVSLSFIYAFLADILSLEWFTNVFMYLSILSIIPNTLAAIFNPCNFSFGKFRRAIRKIYRQIAEQLGRNVTTAVGATAVAARLTAVDGRASGTDAEAAIGTASAAEKREAEADKDKATGAADGNRDGTRTIQSASRSAASAGFCFSLAQAHFYINPGSMPKQFQQWQMMESTPRAVHA
eukprot:3792669-Rhodomonas_salina.1